MTDYHPPTGPEIAEHLEAGGRVEHWAPSTCIWWVSPADQHAEFWRMRPTPQPGYRLVPLPPKTERVMAWEAVRDGRRVLMEAGPSSEIFMLVRAASGGLFAQVTQGSRFALPDDGRIEVLVEES